VLRETTSLGRGLCGLVAVPITIHVCACLLLQDLVQSCLRLGGGIWEDMCYERRRAEACVD
jgi:hypothetical protein